MTSGVADPRSDRPVRDAIERHPAAAFVLLTFVLSWLFWVPGVIVFLRQREPVITTGPLLLALLGSYGPTFAAFALTGLARGRPGVRELAGRYLKWRVGVRWPVLAFFLPAVVFLGGLTIKVIAGAAVPPLAWRQLTVAALFSQIAFNLPSGPLGEEAGWRGYLLPALQRRRPALMSSVIIGVVWAVWHLPMFWVPGVALPLNIEPSVQAAVVYLLAAVATSIVATSLYNSSGGSLLVAVLYHLGLNVWPQLLLRAFVGGPTGAWADLRFAALAAIWTLAIVVIARLGPVRLSRNGVVTT